MGIRRKLRWIIPEAKKLLFGVKCVDYKDIPIVINNFNRLETLLILIAGLEQRGYRNIHIIDNNSSYPPLLKYYIDSCPYPVYMLHRNVGHLALWQTGLYKQFGATYIAYTDSDLEIHPDCPDDFIEHFISLLRKYPRALKVGFSIAIDDLPNCFALKQKVCDWESQFWQKKIEPNVYKAPIDTTFAVHKPYFVGEPIDFRPLYLRVGPPYSVRHLPWYVDSNCPTPEEQYYIDHIKTSTHWSVLTKK